MITITHVASGQSKSFASPRDAAKRMAAIKANKNTKDETFIVDNPGTDLSAYASHVPEYASLLIEVLESTYSLHIPRWRFIERTQYMQRYGATHYNPDRTVSHITINIEPGTSPETLMANIIHEFSHALLPYGEDHGRRFYRTAFALYRKFLSKDAENEAVRIKWGYKKKSKYWYAELWNVESMLSRYQRPTYVHRETPQERTNKAITDIFSEDE